MRSIEKWTALVAAIGCMQFLGAAQAASMSVQVRETQVRSTPDFLGKIAGTLAYGDAVETSQTQGGWVKVSTKNGVSGWVSASALSSKKIALSSSGKSDQLGASADEVATAGKGFSKEVEDKYKAKNRNIDFTWVDRMEKIKISPAEASEFLIQGQVRGKGGAQ